MLDYNFKIKINMNSRNEQEGAKNGQEAALNNKQANTPNNEQSPRLWPKNKVISAIAELFPPRYKSLTPNVEYFEKLRSGKSILLTGQVGTGKTRILLETLLAFFVYKMSPIIEDDIRAIDKKMIEHVRRHFITTADALRKIKDEYDYAPESGGIVKFMMNTEMLFLDDLGAEKSTDWVKEQLYIVINERYNWLKPTLITTNLTIGEIAKNYGDRFASRLVEMCEIIKITGDDRRINK